MMALDQAVYSGRALYVGISSYSAAKSREAARIARELGTPLLIHQPSYNMFNRWVETGGLVDACENEGMAAAARIQPGSPGEHGLHRRRAGRHRPARRRIRGQPLGQTGRGLKTRTMHTLHT